MTTKQNCPRASTGDFPLRDLKHPLGWVIKLRVWRSTTLYSAGRYYQQDRDRDLVSMAVLLDITPGTGVNNRRQ